MITSIITSLNMVPMYHNSLSIPPINCGFLNLLSMYIGHSKMIFVLPHFTTGMYSQTASPMQISSAAPATYVMHIHSVQRLLNQSLMNHGLYLRTSSVHMSVSNIFSITALLMQMTYLKLSYFSSTQILAILMRGLWSQNIIRIKILQ